MAIVVTSWWYHLEDFSHEVLENKES